MLSQQVSALAVVCLTCCVGLSPVLLEEAGVVAGVALTVGRSREVVGLTPFLPLHRHGEHES